MWHSFDTALVLFPYTYVRVCVRACILFPVPRVRVTLGIQMSLLVWTRFFSAAQRECTDYHHPLPRWRLGFQSLLVWTRFFLLRNVNVLIITIPFLVGV